MPIIKTTAKKQEAPKKEVEQKVSEILVSGVADTISVKIKKNTQYSADGIELIHIHQLLDGETAEETLQEMIEKLSGIANGYIEQFVEVGSDQIEESNEEPEPEEITQQRILTMEREELVALIKDNELDVDPKKHRKLANLRDAVAAVVFPEEEEPLSPEVDGGEEGDEGEGITVDAIREMEREELVELISSNELDINPKKYKKAAELAEAIIELLQASEGNEGEEEGEGISEEMVREMERPELVELINSQELDINPAKYKKLPELIEKVVELLFADDQEGQSEFDDTDFGDAE